MGSSALRDMLGLILEKSDQVRRGKMTSVDVLERPAWLELEASGKLRKNHRSCA